MTVLKKSYKRLDKARILEYLPSWLWSAQVT